MWGEGTVLAGRYQLRQRIGGGSMGDVWRALDTVLGREVAVKILLPALLDDAGFAARFHTEARVLAALSHPGIVSVFDYGEADDPRTAFLVMELITGRPLSDLLDESAPLSEATTLTIVAQTLEALQAAHDQGIVHRDVKPANLMLRGGTVVVTDFGVARTADARRLTAADVVLGTAVYAAPEQARHTAVTAAADQYAVGVIAYECLTGAPPFDSGTPLGIMMKHLQEPVPPLPDTVSAPVRALVMRALAKDPAERFASAREMAETARRLAALPASLTRIGTPQDSFQTGVDVAAVEAAAAGAARADGDFLSFTVLPRDEEAVAADESGVEGAEELSSDGGEAPKGVPSGPVGEGSPAWASYVVGPSAEGADWASFTVRGGVEAAEAEPEAEAGSTVPLPDAEGESESEPEGSDGGEVRDVSRRMVPQDSFIAGVSEEAVSEARGAGVAEAGRSRGRFRKPKTTAPKTTEPKSTAPKTTEPKSGEPKTTELKSGEPKTTEPKTTAPKTTAPKTIELKSGEPKTTAPKTTEPKTTELKSAAPKTTEPMPAELKPAQAKATEPKHAIGIASEPEAAKVQAAELKPAELAESKLSGPKPAEPKAAEPLPAQSKATEPQPATAKEVRARIAPGHAMPLDSFTAGVDLASVVDSVDTPEPEPKPQRRRVGVLAAVGVAVVVAAGVAYPLIHNNSSASATVAATQGTSSGSLASSASSLSSPSSPSSAPSTSVAVAPPPVSSSSPAVPHKSGAITNVGDGDALDVFTSTAGAPLYSDGAQLTVGPLAAGRTGQSFQATALTVAGHPAYEFGVGLDTDQLLDAGGGKVALKHCACGMPDQPPTQLWALSQDTSTPGGAFYLNSQALAGQCLTDNGPTIALSLKPCVAGNKAQQWFLP